MTDFYTEATRLLNEANKYNYPVNKKLCEIFNIRSDVSSRRFKSLFGCTIREKL